MNYLENKTLAEKQMHYYNGSRCPYCDNLSELVESSVVYGSGRDYGLMYYCKPCGAHVGTHKGTDQALGPLAKESLRKLRHEAHLYFDPLWKKKIEQGYKRNTARRNAYTWLGDILGVERIEAHIGFLNEEQCRKVIAECRRYYTGTPENDKLKGDFVLTEKGLANIDILEIAAFEYDADIRKVSDLYYDIIHRDTGKVFRFNIETNVGKWDSEEFFKKVSLSGVLKKNFKVCKPSTKKKPLQNSV